MDIIKEVKKYKWYHWVERPYSPFWGFFWGGVDKRYFDRFGLKGFGFGYKANIYQYPYHYQSIEETLINKKAVAKYLKKHSIFDLSRLLAKVHKNSLLEIKGIIKSNESPLKKMERARGVLRLYVPLCWTLPSFEEYYNEKINKLVPKYISGDINKWVGDVSVPKKKNVYALIREELKSNKPLEDILAKYAWAKCRDGFSDFYTTEDLLELKKQIQETVTPKVKIPRELKSLVKELKELTFHRADRTDKLYEAVGLARTIFKEVAEYIGVSFKELSNYDSQSILYGKPERIGVPYTYAYFKGKQVLTKNRIIDFHDEGTEEVRGTIAFGGKVKGVVKIVKHPDELGKVKDGDILVAQSTFPSFISAMHKAVAFVTDEGGITSHAAIIAREMKKPCIIGTKNATKVLKDGDFVEVDANKGIVKIIR